MVGVDGPRGPGSGFAISRSLVLTSSHVVPDVGGEVTFFHPGEKEQYTATVVWRGTPMDKDDAALLRAENAYRGPDGAALSWKPVRWGRLVTHQPEVPCQTVGLPNIVQRKPPADLYRVTGTVNRTDRFANNRHLMRVEERIEGGGTSDRTRSPWGGLSGAAVFCDDVLVGVVAVDFAGFGHTRLEISPAYVLLNDPAFQDVLAEDHLPTRMEPAEWQRLYDPPAPPLPGGPLTSPAALLDAHRAVVPFRGRARLLHELGIWCDQPGLGVRLVHAPGGQGKTRLALELADRLEAKRWTVVWLTDHADDAAVQKLADAAVPLLVILDHAETRLGRLTVLLRALAAHRGSTPFKMLLLARTRGDWWNAARRAHLPVQNVVEAAPVTALPPLQSHDIDIRKAYCQAVDSLSRALHGVDGRQNDDWPTIARDLKKNCRERLRSAEDLQGALTLHMTALVDLLDAGTPDPAHDVDAPGPVLDERLLDHEIAYWESAADRSGTGLRREDLPQALAAAFLCGADDGRQADTLLRGVPVLSDLSTRHRYAVRDWISALYPPQGGRVWAELRPDRLAEYFVGRQLRDDPGLVDDLFADSGLTMTQTTRLLTVYARAAAHPAHRGLLDAELTALCVRRKDILLPVAVDVATRVERPEPLVCALKELAERTDATPQDLADLADRLPRPTHSLGPLAVQVTQRLAAIHREQTEADPARLADLATTMRRLTGRLGDLGRRREALAAAEESSELAARLADRDGRTYLPQYAASLINVSVMLGRLGEREKALRRARAAVRAYEQLTDGTDASPSAVHLSELSHALSAVSTAEGELGHFHEALENIGKAVSLRRDLLEQYGETYKPALADALNNQAIWLKESGRPEKAMRKSQEAVALYQALAEERPDAFRPRLAMTLGTHANCLSATGRYTEALAANEEAVRIRRRLADENPNAHLADLALSLNSLAINLDNEGRHDDALPAAAETVDLYEQLADREPSVYTPELAASLNTYANQLNTAGRNREACEAAGKAVDHYRSLARKEPGVFTADLAMSLTTLSSQQDATGQYEEALASARKAVALHRRLDERRSDAFLPGLGMSLNNLSLRWKAMGGLDKALTLIDEAIGIQRRLIAAGRTGPTHTALAMALVNKASCLFAMGQREAAVQPATEAVKLFRRRMSRSNPDAYKPELATALSVLAAVLTTTGHRVEALDSWEALVKVRKPLAARDSAGHGPHYVNELLMMGTHRSASGRHDAAVAALRQAVATCRKLAYHDPDQQRFQLAVSTAVLTAVMTQAGRRREALPTAEEAVTLLRDLHQDDPAQRPVFADALVLLGVLRHCVGHAEARHALQQAVDMAQSLAPAVQGPVLTRALMGLGTWAGEQGQTAQAMSLLTQAVAVARSTPEDPGQAAALASALWSLGRYAPRDEEGSRAALRATAEAVEICDSLVRADATAHEPLLADALAVHGLRSAVAGQYAEALRITTEALDLSRRLADADPTAHHIRLADALSAHAEARLLADVHHDEARETVAEALTLWRGVSQHEPGLAAPRLSQVLDTYTRLLGDDPD
ncbi:serine protease [Streptomyces pactum]|uniref:Serine protease n=1 Tax=Streptomyces pactum TaxID=68249 RepID=A0A1S6JII0_9ACTN|nr:serine protease [Streptomyces pactum]